MLNTVNHILKHFLASHVYSFMESPSNILSILKIKLFNKIFLYYEYNI